MPYKQPIQGTLYFMALLLLNVLDIVIKIFYENSQASLPKKTEWPLYKLKCKQNPAAYVTVFLPPISSILISRFILNLRQVSLGSMDLNTTSPSSRNTLDFRSRLVGNFGAEVQHTSLVFENVEDDTEDEQNISGDCEAFELAQVQ
ncbi:uncharacterized protein LAESUDRAFT_757525 [Laetiporus sulphureus 93-53]|uniref:Uncharacterized protein n=1 Tax=Laetiporus sulphureus 93-53 TaxID=1314785 RepID=A0A165FDZ4_9APHY|nr:uncharacterized protein LAESUDRAFT_757525 [Laetiporus sulphureus 93-53]KZT08826.1 hypothetical protein LAESUDRAFT_757525 [Laetiporus sulphureus 93-53]